MHLCHDYQLFPQLKSTILNSENRILLNFLAICPKTDFFKEIFRCCFFLFIVPYHAKTSQEDPQIFCPNRIQIAHLLEKRYFGKFGCYYCIPSVFFHATTFQKNHQRANHKTEGCIIFAQTGCDLLPKKFFLWKS